MTICERRALQVEWEAGEPGVIYRMPVALARERVARAGRRKDVWWLDHTHSLVRFLSDRTAESLRAIGDCLPRIADGLGEIAAAMRGEAS